MSKTKTPFFSLKSTGTVAKTITTQKIKGTTLVRARPVPTDPRSDAQLAQRQKYRDAVAEWNAFSPEEKDAYRGVCPGLSPYPCFLRGKLGYVAPEPPPEELTEEQTQHNKDLTLYAGSRTRCGQRLTITNRQVLKLGFWLRIVGSPTGDVTFEIRRVSDDSLICEKLWGLAQDLPYPTAYEEIEFDDPQTINEEVRIVVHYEGGSSGNSAVVRYQDTDVKPDEHYSTWIAPDWTDIDTRDFAYRYKYYQL